MNTTIHTFTSCSFVVPRLCHGNVSKVTCVDLETPFAEAFLGEKEPWQVLARIRHAKVTLRCLPVMGVR